MLITKSEDATKQGFCKILLKITPSSGRSLYYLLLEFLWQGVGWGGCLFEAGRLLELSANSRLGA